jgi:Ca2+-transporting ATPase
MNHMTVEKVYTDGNLLNASDAIPHENMALKVMCYANDTKIGDKTSGDKLIGDPTETALIQYALNHQYDVLAQLDNEPRVAELPFDSERKLMSTVHKLQDGRLLIACKGAPDQLLQRCDMTDSEKQHILEMNSSLAKQALRVLAFAYKYVDAVPELESSALENGLTFAGMAGMIDPERKEAAEAVRVAREAGVRPIMITGDHQDTAEAIARRLGIITPEHDDAVITGAELDKLSDDEFQKNIRKYCVYARVSPEHKVRIVKAWQTAGGPGRPGYVVAMTGDGVNDAPSLKIADIGIGMGITGTEVSKGAADMVLADDNFATIIKAIEEGRKIFANIQKAVQYLLSANTAEVLTIFIATLAGWDVLLPIHLLWINLVTDTFPAIALGMEPAEPNIMRMKPRGRAASFFSGGVMSSIIYQGILQGALTLGVYGAGLLFPMHPDNPALMHADALTMSFITLGLIQLFHAFNVKSVRQSVFTVGPFRSRVFNLSILGAFIMLAVTVVVPGFNSLFHVSHLDWHQWLIVVIGSGMIVVLVEMVKAIQRKLVKE